jgi:hypothetical protein
MKISFTRKGPVIGAAASLALVAAALMTSAAGIAAWAAAPEVKAKPAVGKAVTRRLTPTQYRNIIDEVFGPAIELGGRFEPDLRVNELIEIGTGQVSVSSVGMAQFDTMARAIAAQVVGERNRGIMIPCKPQDPAAADDACATQFLTGVGRLLFRRPLTEAESRRYVEAANIGAKSTKDFYTGLSLSLGAMLSSPQFLFRQVKVESEPGRRGQYRLDSYSKATRLSFFLWNSMPDEMLIQAAEKGELDSRRGLTKHVDRMIASPRLEAGVSAFFADMFRFDGLVAVSKDTTLYPKFDSIVAANAQEQTLRTVSNVLVTQRADYREIFTTRKTYLTQALASVYNVPLINDVPNGSPDSWQPFEFPADDPRAGVLTHLSFLALHSHPGRSSPTLRGKALREIMLCQKVPAPPGDVTFQLVQDTNSPVYRTARDRLQAHSGEPMCAGCHKITDPMGLALEHFDGSGSYRDTENGVRMDTKGALDGKAFDGAVELGLAVAQNPAAPNCLVDRMSSYAMGRLPVGEETAWVAALKKDFAKDGYVVPELMKRIVLSPQFYRTPAPASGQTEAGIANPTTSHVQ